MAAPSYEQRRGPLEAYFDRTAVDAWTRLTSDEPVGRIRATVRAGREEMRDTLVSWLPQDLSGRRVLDAGCGTGMLAVEAARRGAEVVAIDLSPTLVGLARERSPEVRPGCIDFRVGDLRDTALGHFDHVVAMDSLIHYPLDDMLGMLDALAGRTRTSLLFTFAPRTAPLAAMHAVGQLFPKSDRSPAIEPVEERRLRGRLAERAGPFGLAPGRTHRVRRGFYISQAMELRRT